MGIVLESARLIKVRWDLSDADFRRILTFCTLLAFAATLYVFAASQEAGGGFHGAAQHGGPRHGHFQPENLHHIFSAGCRYFCFCSSRRKHSAPAKKSR